MRSPSRARLALRAAAATAALLPLAGSGRAVSPQPPPLPHRVWYVDNAAGPQGDGSLVAPFDRLSRAARVADAGDTIYVFHGDGTDRGLDDGIRLRPYQHLIGAGVAFTTADGEPLVAGEPPVLSARSGPVVTLADHATVEGLALVGSGEAVVLARGVDDLRLTAVRVEGTATTGIQLQDSERVTLDGVTVAGARRRALLLSSARDVTLRGCRLEQEGGAEGDAALALRDAHGAISVERGEVLASGGAALRLDAVQGDVALRLTGVTLGAGAATGTTPVTGLDVHAGGSAAVTIAAGALALVQLRGAGVAASLDGTARLQLELTGSGSPDPQHVPGKALQVDARAQSAATLLVRGNDLLASDMGAMLSASGQARLQATLDTNAVGGPSPARGLVLLLGDQAEAALTLTGNKLAGQRAEAVYVVAAARSHLGLDAHDNQVEDSSTLTASPVPSLLVETRDGAAACIALHDNHVGAGSGGGPSLALRQVGDSSLALTGAEALASQVAGQRMAVANRLGRIEIELRPGRTLASPAGLACPSPPGLPASKVAQE